MRALFEERFEAYGTPEVVAEYHLAFHSRSVRMAAEFVRLLPTYILEFEQAVVECVELVEPGPSFRCDDPDDEKFTAASSGARADYLVSSDDKVLKLRAVLEAEVVTPEDFLEVIAPHG